MMLSKNVVTLLRDLIENRLAMMSISDQDDLREKMTLQLALSELGIGETIPAGLLNDFQSIPRRGRRRKVGGMVSA